MSSSRDNCFEGIEKVNKKWEKYEEDFKIMKKTIKKHLNQECETKSENENSQEINQKEMSDVIGIKDELVVILDPKECVAKINPMLREDDEKAYEEEVITTSHFSSEGKDKTPMEPTIEEAVLPPEFSNKEDLETNFSPTTKEYEIKEGLVARAYPE